MTSKVYLRYIGNAFIPGIPAKDLTEEEAKQHGERVLLNSGLWELAEQPKPTKKTKKDGD